MRSMERATAPSVLKLKNKNNEGEVGSSCDKPIDLVGAYVPAASQDLLLLPAAQGTKLHWTLDQDRQLYPAKTKNPNGTWPKISPSVPGKTFKQCRDRWFNHVDPTINHGEWSREEDAALLQKQKLMGNKWAEIARQLPGRTENSVKNRHRSISRKEDAEPSSKCPANACISQSDPAVVGPNRSQVLEQRNMQVVSRSGAGVSASSAGLLHSLNNSVMENLFQEDMRRAQQQGFSLQHNNHLVPHQVQHFFCDLPDIILNCSLQSVTALWALHRVRYMRWTTDDGTLGNVFDAAMQLLKDACGHEYDTARYSAESVKAWLANHYAKRAALAASIDTATDGGAGRVDVFDLTAEISSDVPVVSPPEHIVASAITASTSQCVTINASSSCKPVLCSTFAQSTLESTSSLPDSAKAPTAALGVGTASINGPMATNAAKAFVTSEARSNPGDNITSASYAAPAKVSTCSAGLTTTGSVSVDINAQTAAGHGAGIKIISITPLTTATVDRQYLPKASLKPGLPHSNLSFSTTTSIEPSMISGISVAEKTANGGGGLMKRTPICAPTSITANVVTSHVGRTSPTSSRHPSDTAELSMLSKDTRPWRSWFDGALKQNVEGCVNPSHALRATRIADARQESMETLYGSVMAQHASLIAPHAVNVQPVISLMHMGASAGTLAHDMSKGHHSSGQMVDSTHRSFDKSGMFQQDNNNDGRKYNGASSHGLDMNIVVPSLKRQCPTNTPYKAVPGGIFNGGIDLAAGVTLRPPITESNIGMFNNVTVGRAGRVNQSSDLALSESLRKQVGYGPGVSSLTLEREAAFPQGVSTVPSASERTGGVKRKIAEVGNADPAAVANMWHEDTDEIASRNTFQRNIFTAGF